MALKRIALGIGGALLLSSSPKAPSNIYGIIGPRPAYAKAAAPSYNSTTNPFFAGPLIIKLANSAGSGGSALDRAKALHISARAKLKLLSSGKTQKQDDRPPHTAEETAKLGGDCTGHTNALIALLKLHEFECGALIIKVGKVERHVLPFAEIGGKRYIIDTQTREFGKGRARFSSGKVVSFTYEQAVKKHKATLLSADQAKSIYHMEWGNYLKMQKGKEEEAMAAFKTALGIFDYSYTKRQLIHVRSRLVNRLNSEAVAAYNSKKFAKAAELFTKALQNLPETVSKENRKKLEQLIKQAKEAAQKAKE